MMEYTNAGDGSPQQFQGLTKYIPTDASKEDRLVPDTLFHGDDGSGAMFLLRGQGVTHENDLSRGHSHISSSEPSAKRFDRDEW